jgi:hypothetical protein
LKTARSYIRLNQFAGIVFGYFFLLLLYRMYSHSMLWHTIGQPVKGPDTDYTFWLSHLLYFPQFIIRHSWAGLLVDAAVIMLTIVCFISDRYRPYFCTLLVIFFFMQRITVESYSCSHTKSISCLFIALLPFCFKKKENTVLLIEFGRYFLIYILVISAYHKLVNGGLGHENSFSNTLILQHADLATLNPAHAVYGIATFLISHPVLADASFKFLFVLQLSFFAGIFTKRLDRILFGLLLLFAISSYLVMRIYNFDIILLGLTLLYFPVGKKSG